MSPAPGWMIDHPTTCSEPDCERPRNARGLCDRHYHRLAYAGKLPTRIVPTVLERLMAQSVELANGCFVWTGAVDGHDYGRLSVNGRQEKVHRLAWVERHGSIPAETPHVLHRCDTPRCWADKCLWLGTHAENMADMAAKRRARGGEQNRAKNHCPQGHPYDYVYANGWRGCTICRQQAARDYEQRMSSCA